MKLIILQFGLNVSGDPEDEETYKGSYSHFYKIYNRQLQYLKRVAPDVSILVVGVSDRSMKINDAMVTMPSIPKIVRAQKDAAFANKCGFFNLFEAMGGNGSMPVWVAKGLADSHYTHFTGRGARNVANMIYEAIKIEYDSYRAVFK